MIQRAVRTLFGAGLALAGFTTGAFASQAAEPGLPFNASRGVASRAFAELVILDRDYLRCARTTTFEAMRGCFHTTVLPADCRQYYRSIENAAELVAARDGLSALAPAALEFMNFCREGAPLRIPADPERRDSSLSPVEWLLGRRGLADPHIGHLVLFPRGQSYIADLCSNILDGRLRDLRTSELLFCSDPADVEWEHRGIIRDLLSRR